MSEGFEGADPARMAELERVLSGGADAIANVNGQTFNVIGAIRMIWRGQVMEAFESLWRSQHSVRIGAAEDALRNAAEIVRRNLEAQIETSATLTRGAQGGAGAAVGVGIAVQAGERAAPLTHADRARAIGDPQAALPDGEPDQGDTLTEERREDFDTPDGDANAAIIEALDHTTDPTRIAKDEFEIVYLDNGTAIIVLPGVTDLTSTLVAGGHTLVDPATGLPRLAEEVGWNPDNYTARDTWLAAHDSLPTASIDDNVYAQLVEDYIEQQINDDFLKRGADVMIVGHSFGADTALDLASDSNFNGGLVNVTHVVAAAYHSEPQLASVPDGTQVAVLQNMNDPAIAAEALASGDFGAAARPFESLGRNVAEDQVNLGVAGVNVVSEGGAEVAEQVTEGSWNAVASVGNFFVPGDPIPSVELEFDAPDIGSVDFTQASVTNYGDNIVVSQFYGGLEGAGHGQGNYTDYLAAEGAGHFEDFLSDAANAGFTGTGASIAVDVSVPEDMR